MSVEKDPKEVSSMHFDMKTRRLMTILEDQTVLQFTLTHDLRLLYNGHFKAAATPEATVREAVVHQVEAPTQVADQLAAAEAGPRTPEKQPVVTLTGKMTEDLKPGRQDRSGLPTVYGTAAMHQEANDQAKMVIVSFHRHATELAKANLSKGTTFTASGYLREAPPPKEGEEPRKAAFSAFHLIQYPGKPPKQES